jgi:hypothetical protein
MDNVFKEQDGAFKERDRAFTGETFFTREGNSEGKNEEYILPSVILYNRFLFVHSAMLSISFA